MACNSRQWGAEGRVCVCVCAAAHVVGRVCSLLCGPRVHSGLACVRQVGWSGPSRTTPTTAATQAPCPHPEAPKPPPHRQTHTRRREHSLGPFPPASTHHSVAAAPTRLLPCPCTSCMAPAPSHTMCTHARARTRTHACTHLLLDLVKALVLAALDDAGHQVGAQPGGPQPNHAAHHKLVVAVVVGQRRGGREEGAPGGGRRAGNAGGCEAEGGEEEGMEVVEGDRVRGRGVGQGSRGKVCVWYVVGAVGGCLVGYCAGGEGVADTAPPGGGAATAARRTFRAPLAPPASSEPAVREMNERLPTAS